MLSLAHREIFAVGDDDQSIYGWRGADVSLIRRFCTDFPDATQVRLEENFRSTGHILDSANAMIARDRSRLGKTLYTRKAGGDPIEVVPFDNAKAEAAGVVSELQRRHTGGMTLDCFSILYRNNALSRGYEEALMRTRIPYALVGDVGFYQRAEVKDALALLRLLSTPDDVQGDEALRRVINVPARGLGPKAMALLEAEAAWRQLPLLAALETVDLPPKARSAGLGFVAAIRSVACAAKTTLADQLSMLLDTTGYRAMLRTSRAETSEGQLENLQELIQLAGEFHTTRELLDHAALATRRDGEQEPHRVKLMTMHKAKGLEFPHVFLVAFEQGVVPSDFGDLEEERRLAYVAITRAMERLTITHCDYRRGPMQPSRFLDDIPTENRVFNWLHSPIGGTPRERPAGSPDSTRQPAWLGA